MNGANQMNSSDAATTAPGHEKQDLQVLVFSPRNPADRRELGGVESAGLPAANRPQRHGGRR